MSAQDGSSGGNSGALDLGRVHEISEWGLGNNAYVKILEYAGDDSSTSVSLGQNKHQTCASFNLADDDYIVDIDMSLMDNEFVGGIVLKTRNGEEHSCVGASNVDTTHFVFNFDTFDFWYLIGFRAISGANINSIQFQFERSSMMQPTFAMTQSVTYGDAEQTTLDSITVLNTVSVLSAEITWNDQGLGYQKGHVFMDIKRAGTTLLSRSLFGKAPHESQSESVTLSNCVFEEVLVLPGDEIVLWQITALGTNGGHSLTIDDFSFDIKYGEPLSCDPNYHWILDGNFNGAAYGGLDKEKECTLDSATHGIASNDFGNEIGLQCCNSAGDTAYRDVDGTSMEGYGGCSSAVTYSEAEQICVDEGYRLCTLDEVLSLVGAGKGCTFDAYHVWTATECFPTVSPTPAPSKSPTAPTTPFPTPSPTPIPEYRVLTIKAFSLDEARTACEDAGMQIASVHSSAGRVAAGAECFKDSSAMKWQYQIVSSQGDFSGCYLGMTYDDDAGWAWDDGSALDYGFYNDGSAIKATVQNGAMNDPWELGLLFSNLILCPLI